MKKNTPHQVNKPQPISPAPVETGNSFSPQSAWMLLLFIFTVLLYINTIGHGYVLDDVAVIEQNKFVQQGISGIPSILTTFYWQGYWELNTGLYRPLSLIMFAFEQEFMPGNPLVGHFVNILLFAACVVLLFKLLLRLFGSQYVLIPVLTALLFGAHPIHTEVVANIKSRDELLAMFLLMAGSIFLLKYLDGKKALHLLVAVAAYILSLFAKESSLAFIAVFALLIYYKGHYNLKQAALTLAPFAVAAVVYLALHQLVLYYAPANVGFTYRDNSLLASSSYLPRLATAILMMGKYLWLMLWPHPLRYDYSFQHIPIVGFADWRVLASIASYAVLAWAGFKGLKTKSALGFGIAFFAITIVITSNLFFTIGATMAERFLFTPSVGLCLAAAYLLSKYLNKSGTTTLKAPLQMMKANLFVFAVVLSITAAYGFTTVNRNTDWRDNDTLFIQDATTTPNSYNVQYNYGTALLLHGYEQEQEVKRKAELLDKSIEVLQRAVSIDTLGKAAYINLASALFKARRYNESLVAINTAIRIDSFDVKLYYFAGLYAYRAQKPNVAITNLNKAISKGVVGEDVYRYLGVAYFDVKDYPSAIASYNRALAYNNKNVETLLNAANTYAISSQYDTAAVYFKQALALAPTNVAIQNGILQLYTTTSQTDSIALYTQLFGRK